MKLKSLTNNQADSHCSPCLTLLLSRFLVLTKFTGLVFGAYFFHILVSDSVACDFLAQVIDGLVFNVSNNVDLSAHMAMSLRRVYA